MNTGPGVLATVSWEIDILDTKEVQWSKGSIEERAIEYARHIQKKFFNTDELWVFKIDIDGKIFCVDLETETVTLVEKRTKEEFWESVRKASESMHILSKNSEIESDKKN